MIDLSNKDLAECIHQLSALGELDTASCEGTLRVQLTVDVPCFDDGDQADATELLCQLLAFLGFDFDVDCEGEEVL